jgi:hypothetical protein
LLSIEQNSPINKLPLWQLIFLAAIPLRREEAYQNVLVLIDGL